MDDGKKTLIREFVLGVLRPEGGAVAEAPSLSHREWEYAVGFAESVHSALPFLASASKASWRPGLPEGVQLLVEERLYRERLWMALLDHEVERSVGRLLDSRVPVIVLKGMDLARRFYPERSLRPMADVDLLVPQAKFSEALEILGRGGYRVAGPFPEGRFRVELCRKGGLPQVELHSRLLAGDTETETHGLWDRSREGQLPGLPRGARVLDSSDLFTYLVRHSAVQHLMESPVWLNDLHHVVGSSGRLIDWDRALSPFPTLGLRKSTPPPTAIHGSTHRPLDPPALASRNE